MKLLKTTLLLSMFILVGCGQPLTTHKTVSSSTSSESGDLTETPDPQEPEDTGSPETPEVPDVASPTPPEEPLPGEGENSIPMPDPNAPPSGGGSGEVPPSDDLCGDARFATAEINQKVIDICRMVNEERVLAGKAPLRLNHQLSEVAYAHAKDMHDNGYVSHTGLDGSTPTQRVQRAGLTFRAVGENIAGGNSSATATMDQWMNSSGHRANLLITSYEQTGIGYFQGPNGYRHYWVQIFATQ